MNIYLDLRINQVLCFKDLNNLPIFDLRSATAFLFSSSIVTGYIEKKVCCQMNVQKRRRNCAARSGKMREGGEGDHCYARKMEW